MRTKIGLGQVITRNECGTEVRYVKIAECSGRSVQRMRAEAKVRQYKRDVSNIKERALLRSAM